LYKSSTTVASNPRILHTMLLKDSFNVGLTPANILRTTTVRCQLDNYRTHRVNHVQSSDCNHTIAETKYLRGSELKAQFETLGHIKMKENFELKIVLLQRNVRLGILAEAMDSLRHVYDTFVAAGADVSVLWSYDSGCGWWEHEFYREVKGFFNMSSSEWQAKMLNDWDIDCVSFLVDKET